MRPDRRSSVEYVIKEKLKGCAEIPRLKYIRMTEMICLFTFRFVTLAWITTLVMAGLGYIVMQRICEVMLLAMSGLAAYLFATGAIETEPSDALEEPISPAWYSRRRGDRKLSNNK